MAYVQCKFGRGGGGGDRPNGKTITPTDDIQTWLACAGMTDSYTTINEVLADSSTLAGLMSDANAANYLSRSTSWCSDIASNSSAMTYIGQNDYTSYVLLENTTWRSSICNSSYLGNVLNISIPAMTSNTTPEGECSGYKLNTSGGEPYLMFDGNDSTVCDQFSGSGGTPAQQWAQYTFTKPVGLYALRLRYNINNEGGYLRAFKIQATNSNGSLIDIEHFSRTESVGNTIDFSVPFESYDRSTEYTTWRLQVLSTAINQKIKISTLQFYGREYGDVQSLLHAADIYDKDYTTINEILADSDTLSAIINNSSAIDYLAACTTFASTVCNNQTAMTLIGANNYASNTLLANYTWCEAIAGSDYVESVLTNMVPLMTSNTTPYGTVIFSYGDHSEYKPYMAFDRNDTTKWASSNSSPSWSYVGYTFINPVKIYAIFVKTRTDRSSKVKISSQTDGSASWIVRTSEVVVPEGSTLVQVLNNPDLNYSYRCDITDGAGASGYGSNVYTLKLYGRVDI